MACVHSTSSPPLLTVRGYLKHSCQWSSVSSPIHPQSCLLCNYSSPGFCSAPNLEAALWSARARPSFRGAELPDPSPPHPPPLLLFTLRSRSVLIYKALKRTQLANWQPVWGETEKTWAQWVRLLYGTSKPTAMCRSQNTAIVTAGYCDSCVGGHTLPMMWVAHVLWAGNAA